MNSDVSTTDATFPVGAALTNYTYGNADTGPVTQASAKLINLGNGASFTFTNKTGVIIKSVIAEGVAQNNSAKNTTITLSDGTTTATTGSNSWNAQKKTDTYTPSYSSYSLKIGESTDLSSLKHGIDQVYTVSASGYQVGMHLIITYEEDTTTPVTLSFASASGSLDVATASPSLPLTVSPNVTDVTDNITYSSSNSAVATVNSTGALTLVGIGTTTITASFAGNATYGEASDTYTLTVTDATKLGYTEVLNPDDKTLADRLSFGMSHTSVTQTFANYYSGGAIIDDGAAVSTLYLNGEAAENQYTNTKSWRKTQNGFIVEGKEQWVGYDIEVEENYLLNLTHLDARILIADNTYTWYVEILDKNGTQVYKSANQTTTKASTANLSTDIDVTNLTGTVSVKLWVTQGGSSKRFSIEKLILTGTTAEDTRPVRTITFAAETGSGTAPADVTVREGETFFFPKAPLLYKTGNTLTDWREGSTDHKVGSSAPISDDTDLTAVFTPNTVALGDVATTVDWTFKTGNGAPTINMSYQSATKTVVYSSRATIGTTPFDALMTIDVTTDGAKFDDSFNTTYAQVNANTKFTIPAVNGMVVTFSCNQNPSAVSDVTFAGNNADDFSTDPRTLTYTYSGSASTIDIVVANGGLYPDGISVAYPYVKSKYDAPTITVGEFNFENEGYEVTITKSEGDNLMVSTDGSNYTAQTSPYTTYATTTTHYYAKAIGASYSDSDVADENVTNAFDGGKKYVAWVYESNYTNKPNNYNVANDEIYKALKAIYNVVLVDIKDYKSSMTDDQKTALNGNLDDADLVALSEAAAGDSKAVIGLEDLVGTVPMLNMKLFAYTYKSDASQNRWGWGTPKNVGTATADVTITPVSKLYKVLNGVTFDGNNVALFDYPNEQNHIQYVDSWNAEPANDVVLANVTVSEVNKPVMHASNSLKYFALGLSCDDFTKYNDNAITIVKNAAAMLIANEKLDAEVVSATIGDKGYTTFSSSHPLNLSGMSASEGTVTAYSVLSTGVTASVVTPTEATGNVAANEGLILGGTAGATVTIPIAASGDAISGNLMVGCPTGATISSSTPDYSTIYVLVNTTQAEFQNVNNWIGASKTVTIPAGKAYLNTTVSGGARSLTISFDNLTGIDNVENGEVENSLPAKRIVNGKLVIEKKGMMFNANGQVIK